VNIFLAIVTQIWLVDVQEGWDSVRPTPFLR
jgi:hypothetical protein